jgi:hypothetical protein
MDKPVKHGSSFENYGRDEEKLKKTPPKTEEIYLPMNDDQGGGRQEGTKGKEIK